MAQVFVYIGLLTTNALIRRRKKGDCMVYFHRKPGGWVYLSILGWQPFKWATHGGWACMNLSWFKRFAWTIPKQRGWRWD